MVPQISPELAQQLSQLMHKQGQELSAQQLEALKKLGITPRAGQCSGDPRAMREAAERLAGLCRSLGSQNESMKWIAALQQAKGQGGLHGFGGVNRGGGPPSPLTFDKSAPLLAAGDAEFLTPGMQVRPDGTVVLSETLREAELDDAAFAQAQRAQQQAFAPAAADARAAQVRPQHRAAVRAYFAESTSSGTSQNTSTVSPASQSLPEIP